MQILVSMVLCPFCFSVSRSAECALSEQCTGFPVSGTGRRLTDDRR